MRLKSAGSPDRRRSRPQFNYSHLWRAGVRTFFRSWNELWPRGLQINKELGFERRSEIEGLRALAVIFVIAFHAELPWVSGGYVGVDIFFVISGFLITNLLLREFESTQHISLSNFYARRIRRLLPASLFTVVGTLVLSRIWLEPLRLIDLSRDSWASALFFTNFVFASRGADYLQSALPPSPLQHYWSLAVEEQFYILFPLIVFLLLKLKRGSRTLLIIFIISLSIISLGLSAHFSAINASSAFYLLPFRAWELGAGALLAIFVFKRKTNSINGFASRIVAGQLGWISLICILFTSYFFDSQTTFPGFAAVLPVFATVTIILGGILNGEQSKIGPSRMLATRPLVWIGARSYSLYLWHWPILIIARSQSQSQLNSGQIIACIFTTFIAAEISYRFIERPIHRVPNFLGSTKKSLLFGALMVLLGLVASIISASTRPAIATGADAPRIGGSQLKDLVSNSELMQEVPANLEPPLEQLFQIEKPELYSLGCHDHNLKAIKVCTFGDPNSKTSIALIGDSHAAQWFQPIKNIIEKRNWKLVVYVQSGCSLFSATYELSEDCQLWNNYVLQQIRIEKFPLVIMSNFSNGESLQDEKRVLPSSLVTDNLKILKSAITKFDTKLLYIADTPKPTSVMPICLSQYVGQIQMCTFDLSKAINVSNDRILKKIFSTNKSSYADFTEWFCVNSRCPGIIGNILVYRDYSHISDPYALALTDVVEAEIKEVLKK